MTCGQRALFLDDRWWTGEECWVKYRTKISVEMKMLCLLSSPLPLARPVFAAAGAFTPELMELSDNPLDVCDTVIADGLDTRLLVPAFSPTARARPWPVTLHLNALSSGMKRAARDGRAYDLFDFVVWYSRPLLFELPVWYKRWREAPPLAEVQDEREIALAGMLTRSAPPPAAASGAARGGGGPASGGRDRR